MLPPQRALLRQRAPRRAARLGAGAVEVAEAADRSYQRRISRSRCRNRNHEDREVLATKGPVFFVAKLRALLWLILLRFVAERNSRTIRVWFPRS